MVFENHNAGERAVGEVHGDAASGRRLEERIEALLQETPAGCGAQSPPPR